jgi:hypothetical protein
MDERSKHILEYFPEQPVTDSSAIAWYTIISPVIVAMLVATFLPNLALPAAGLTVFVLWYRRRSVKALPQSVLTIRNAQLLVSDGSGRQLLDVPLAELEDVSLDTKTIQKVQENLSSGIPELRFIDSRVGPAIDNSRIELVTAERTITLTEHYTSSTDATEWFGKIRRFLRQHDWQPLNEREQQ